MNTQFAEQATVNCLYEFHPGKREAVIRDLELQRLDPRLRGDDTACQTSAFAGVTTGKK